MDDEKTGELVKKTTRRDEEYYIAAFKKLEDSGENTWNWVTFFFGSTWFTYRKMFWRGLLFSILERVLCIPAILNEQIIDGMFVPAAIPTLVASVILCFIPRVLLGKFGNAIYYDRIKDRIRDGYHICEKYRPTSILSIFTSSSFCMDSRQAFIAGCHKKMQLII
ncbi:hypothetical protein FACS1894122_10360 [Alphaproteobacteria bacterium]|nr:hypothetical protein FACS1894122_10360 [Alphaproteobacteria bacterium]